MILYFMIHYCAPLQIYVISIYHFFRFNRFIHLLLLKRIKLLTLNIKLLRDHFLGISNIHIYIYIFVNAFYVNDIQIDTFNVGKHFESPKTHTM